MSGCPATIEYVECPICFEDMHKHPTAVFVGASGARTCRHFLHKECSLDVLETKLCPLCRQPFEGIKDVPDFRTDLEGWFELVDFKNSGTLDPQEVAEVFKAQLPVEGRLLDEHLVELWPRWDIDGTGVLTFNEITHPVDGLLVYAQEAFGKVEKPEPPSIQESPKEWFKYWDEDKTGRLHKDEVARALIKTFKISHELVADLRLMLENLWCVLSNGMDSIDMDEFGKPDGLAETVIAYLPNRTGVNTTSLPIVSSPSSSAAGPATLVGPPLVAKWRCAHCTLINESDPGQPCATCEQCTEDPLIWVE
ncbi:hypothetical protein CYMTET_10125 [Cymbomonas tetramitiformis]|uniref:Calmodulin n=1 Tax=Cymbomonas tetramitiformis TaxID=36881 RepID=A0AAE0LEG6_9CHLO|nr:hypothetical protein CYMTET_10125 [Cymbomonas tetramitiformis]